VKLPTKPTKPVSDIGKYTFLVYGREKIGKTTLLSSWPDALFLATEPGTKGLKVYEVACKNWKDVRMAVKLLEEDDSRFQTVVIDTVDRAYDMCLEYTCDKIGIPYPGEDASGRNDWGKSWRAVKVEFLSVVHRIVNTKRGLCFTSHAKETEFSTRSGEKYNRIYPSMSSQARSVIEAFVDIYFYAEYMKDTDGNTQRVLICNGDETIFAGHRAGDFPQILPLLKEGGYDEVTLGFQGKHAGLDPETLRPARQTSQAAAALVRGMKRTGEKKSAATKHTAKRKRRT